MRQSRRFAQQREAVERFRDALIELREELERSPEGITGYFYRWEPRQGREKRAARLRTKVNEAAGPAQAAAATTGLRFHISPPPASRQPAMNVNPIASWTSALEPPNLLTMEHIFDYCDQVIGVLDGEAEEARTKERTLAGRIARFLAFPSEVREAARAQYPRVPPKLAFGAALLSQLFALIVAVVGGLLVLYFEIKLGLSPDP
jgi:hypothetical protein